MKQFTKRRLAPVLLSFSLLLSLIVLPAAAAGEESAQQAAATTLQLGQATSLQYALIEGGEITLTGHAGTFSKTENRALMPDDLYGVGSVSKTYTAVAVMKLVEAGKLSLDTPVVKYIPEFKMADARYQDITVRMLLGHSSGLWGSSTMDGFLYDDVGGYAKDALLSRLETQTLKAAPGAYSVYCNDGFTLAEILVERVSGKSFTEYLHEAVVTPLGLSHTFTPQNVPAADQLASIYFGERTEALPQETLNIIGTGGIYASASDLATFGSVFYTDKVLNKNSREAMMAVEYQKGLWHKESGNTISYGLGLDNVEMFPFTEAGIQAIAKGGDTLNYHASLVVLPEHNMAAAVVSSGGVSSFNQLLAARLLIDALAEKGITVSETAPAFPEATPAEIPASELEKAGYYASTMMSLQVRINEAGEMTIDEMPGYTFRYMSDGSYRDEGNTMLFKLVTEADGNTYFYQKAYATLPGLPPLLTSDYAAQRMTPNPVSDAAWANWELIGTQKFFILNERYSAQTYLLQSAVTLPITRNESGYFNASAISETALTPVSTAPGVGSRDYQPIKLQREGTNVGLIIGDYLAISEYDVPMIYAGGSALCTIQKNGYARWYTVGEAAGKTLTVTAPDESNFYVYNADGSVVASSLFGDTSATLPEGGYLVFLGVPGVQFRLTVQ